LLPTIDLWDWDMVQDSVSKGQPVARLVGCLSRGSSKLHPSLPARGGLLRTAPVCEVHLDLVRVSTGKAVWFPHAGHAVYFLKIISMDFFCYEISFRLEQWKFPLLPLIL
jgi:hypothetical protein